MKNIYYKDISDDLLYVSILLNNKVNEDFNNGLEISILEDCIKKLKSTTLNNNGFITGIE
ncbi:hypothetical protein CPU09_09460 [Mammaliicoccus sciuri]|uniref:hypothetical protein n=1 Tax=Mammaliicoccus sciuri TaxID=1296 RepID=UPI000BBE2DCF|nr:hypothetical protein [Mammaliicoccus sciuri]MEB7783024.1 hypothetical protein [Mammaliicoccus sciuri]PCM40533.1 hypothetical protein CPU09_09460 [Mammaliicoccus sciuri]